TLEPSALMLANEASCVSTRSPGKIADESGTVLPFSDAVPFAYSIAAAVSAATAVPGMIAISSQQSAIRRRDTLVPGHGFNTLPDVSPQHWHNQLPTSLRGCTESR